MTTNNVTDINVNSAPHPLDEAAIEHHMNTWSTAVQASDWQGVINSLNAYADALDDSGADPIVSIPAYLEMQMMLRHAMEFNSRRCCYTPAKGWYDGGVDGENVGK